jgi:phosphoribosylglycinamide formyltransferase-1
LSSKPYNIAIFASGAGTNAANIIKFFTNSGIVVKVIVSNNRNAGVHEIAESNNIETLICSFDLNINYEKLINFLKKNEIDLIVLAGFLKLIPEELIKKYPNKIINIHPALLPKYGGKNMYGMKVHEAVLMNNEKESGITIHFVNQNYDDGEIIFQTKTDISASHTAEEIAQKVHELEYRYYPEIIQKLLTNQLN